MDAFNDPTIRMVAVMSSAQIGKSEILLCVAGYYMHQDPSPMLLLQPTLEMAEAFSKDRLSSMVRDTPALKGLVKDARSRDSNNTLLHKKFPGGHITMVGANSPSSLASRPIRIVLADEIDRFPPSAGTEGDPLSLALKRQATFYNRKTGVFSTPTEKGASRIEQIYLESDQRRFFVPCPHCGEFQTLSFKQIQWQDRPDVAYICFHCSEPIPESKKFSMLRRGEWRKTSTGSSGIAGFHINELYSPWVRWSEIVRDFLEKKDHPEQLKTWVNTSLGETWEDRGEAPAHLEIMNRADPYLAGIVPKGGLVLTSGIDVQKDRIEYHVMAFGRTEWYSVDYRVIPGDTSTELPWMNLDEIISRKFESEDGIQRQVRLHGLDSGYATTEAYRWARKHGFSRVMVLKGSSQKLGALIGKPTPVEISLNGRRISAGVKVWQVDTDLIKREIYNRLRLDEDKPGRIHFPQSYPEEFYLQLTAESLRRFQDRRGYAKLEWVKDRDRNEALDTTVYARAAAAAIGIDRFPDERWKKFEEQKESRPPMKASAQPGVNKGKTGVISRGISLT